MWLVDRLSIVNHPQSCFRTIPWLVVVVVVVVVASPKSRVCGTGASVYGSG